MPITREKLIELDAQGWELYHIQQDWTENHNLAADHRDKLIELIGMWYVEAGKYNVLPIDSRGVQRLVEERPQLSPDRQRFTYYPGTSPAPENVAVRVLNRPHTIKADVEIERANGQGVIFCQGSASGGYSLFLKDHRLHYVHNYVGAEEFHVVSDREVPEGRHELAMEFRPTGQPDPAHGRGAPGVADLYVDGMPAGSGEIPTSVPLTLGLGGGLNTGRNAGSAISSEYEAPFPFTGVIHKVVVDVSGEHMEDEESHMKAVMARQ
jgi:arylsulfatase